LFHAHCDAGLWAEADGCLVALENPKHRFLAPALERDLLLHFFPDRDWRKPPLWRGFGRWRSLAICFEMLGQYEDALEAYRPADAALRGDALLALGRLEPLLNTPQRPAPWQTLWQAYRCHALCLAGRVHEAVALARSLVPVDVYEWVHVFECLLRADSLDAMDLKSVLFRSGNEHRWADLACRRMRADYLRRSGTGADLEAEYRQLLSEYERAGLSYERALTGLSLSAWLAQRGRTGEANDLLTGTWNVVRLAGLHALEVDVLERLANPETPEETDDSRTRRRQLGITGPIRP
jgi:tetratricopeptide (TPR) repeat protein